MNKRPSYDLDEIKELLSQEDSRIISQRDRLEAVRLGYADADEMVARVAKLTRAEFHKSMPGKVYSNLFQDVYYTYDGSVKLYIKLQISFNHKGVIVSFKEA